MITDRYRHANALPLTYRARRALLVALIAVWIATWVLAVLAVCLIVAVYGMLALVSPIG